MCIHAAETSKPLYLLVRTTIVYPNQLKYHAVIASALTLLSCDSRGRARWRCVVGDHAGARRAGLGRSVRGLAGPLRGVDLTGARGRALLVLGRAVGIVRRGRRHVVHVVAFLRGIVRAIPASLLHAWSSREETLSKGVSTGEIRWDRMREEEEHTLW